MTATVERRAAPPGPDGNRRATRRFRLLAKVRQLDRWNLSRLGIILGAAILARLAITEFGRPYNFFDLRIYHGAVQWWAQGGDIYLFISPGTTLGFTYPPFAALLMLPMAPLSVAVAGWINVAASVAALAVGLAVVLVPIADRCGWPRWFAVALAVPLAAPLEPIRETFGFGQVNLLLFALVMADVLALRWRKRALDTAAIVASSSETGVVLAHRPSELARRLFFSGAWAGVGVGLATAIKLTPALFILYFVVTRQWRTAITATATAAAATFVAFVFAGQESVTFFSTMMWQTSRVGEADMTPNQSLAGLLARLYNSPETPGLMWLAFAMLLLAVGMIRASSAHREGDEVAAFTVVGLTANVISPISWSHHLVFVVPAIIILADVALRRWQTTRSLAAHLGITPPNTHPLAGLRYALAAGVLYLLFLLSPIWWYEHRIQQESHYVDGLLGVLGENSFALALIVLVATLPARQAIVRPIGLRAAALRSASARPAGPHTAPARRNGPRSTVARPASPTRPANPAGNAAAVRPSSARHTPGRSTDRVTDS